MYFGARSSIEQPTGSTSASARISGSLAASSRTFWRTARLTTMTRCLDVSTFVVASSHGRFMLDCKTQTQGLLRAASDPHTIIVGHMTWRQLQRRPGHEIDLCETRRGQDQLTSMASLPGLALAPLGACPHRGTRHPCAAVIVGGWCGRLPTRKSPLGGCYRNRLSPRGWPRGPQPIHSCTSGVYQNASIELQLAIQDGSDRSDRWSTYLDSSGSHARRQFVDQRHGL